MAAIDFTITIPVVQTPEGVERAEPSKNVENSDTRFLREEIDDLMAQIDLTYLVEPEMESFNASKERRAELIKECEVLEQKLSCQQSANTGGGLVGATIQIQ